MIFDLIIFVSIMFVLLQTVKMANSVDEVVKFGSCAKNKNVCESKEQFLQQRKSLINSELHEMTGGNIKLSANESKVNSLIVKLKNIELQNALKKDGYLAPEHHFFFAKKFIDDSDVFKIIKKMPKGACLHIHDGSMTDVHWLIKNATYDPHCYMCIDKSGMAQFKFSNKTPQPTKDCPKWNTVNHFRNSTIPPSKFDKELFSALTLITDDPRKAYPTQNAIWKKFDQTFASSAGLIFYAPVFRRYFEQGFKEMYDDNVQYIEIRALLGPVYELDGTEHDREWVLNEYKNVADKFVKDHSDFAGAKVIFTSTRRQDASVIAEHVKDAISLKKKFPDFMAGYDLVGHEDAGHPLIYFLDELLQPSQTGSHLPYYFHAGETNFEGTEVDTNLLDALLLNTTRIGHGYAITRHPEAMKMAKQKDVPLEVCPISNQVLMLVDDLRNHPAASLLQEGFPMIISADDPSLWGASGLSYDYYEAFVGFGGEWADLRTLKQLAINSIKYSAMNATEKEKTMQLWQKKWDKFIADIIKEYNL